MLKQKNTAKYECCKQCQALQRGLFLLLFELLIGELSATVTVLALMMKQEELYVSTCAVLGEQGAMFRDGREEKQLVCCSL